MDYVPMFIAGTAVAGAAILIAAMPNIRKLLPRRKRKEETIKVRRDQGS